MNKDAMTLQPNIAKTILYSLLFAMGGAPTIAMLLIQGQSYHPDIFYQAFVGLSVMIACVLAPAMLIQNAYLLFKRNDAVLDLKIQPLMKAYFVLNIACLLYWLYMQFIG